MKNMRVLETFVLSILAGMMISIGGIVNLSLDNKVLGAFLFSIGLFFVVTRQFALFTGKVGYLVDNKGDYLIRLSIIWIGNFFGTFMTGNLMRMTRQIKIAEKAIALCDVKINDSILSIFILSIFCGVLMYLAVDGYKTIEHGVGKCLAIILSVMVFILCGFEHCVANMFYFSVAGYWSSKVIFYLVIMSIGNGVGAVLVAAIKKQIDLKA